MLNTIRAKQKRVHARIITKDGGTMIFIYLFMLKMISLLFKYHNNKLHNRICIENNNNKIIIINIKTSKGGIMNK